MYGSRFESTVPRSGILLVTFRFPSVTGVPEGHESADLLPCHELWGEFKKVVDLLEQPFRELLTTNPSDAVVADPVLHWAAVASAESSIPCYSFPGIGCFAASVEHTRVVNMPHRNVISVMEPFLVPGLPDTIYLTKPQFISGTTFPVLSFIELYEGAPEAVESTTGWLVNTFSELESTYIEHYARETGKPVYHVGPVCLASVSKEAVAERGHGTELAAESERILRWLDGKPALSVVYVSFGSVSRLPEEQLREIGFGLVDSGVPFIWAVGKGDCSGDVADEVEAAAGEAGQVIGGWAPQFAILGHFSVGTFVTHCGWGAVTEAAAAGKPMLTWPPFSEQFYNEKSVVQVAGIGSPMRAEDESVGNLLGREKVAGKVRWAHGAGAQAMRNRAREVGLKARHRVGKAGTSWASVECMMDDIRKHKEHA